MSCVSTKPNQLQVDCDSISEELILVLNFEFWLYNNLKYKNMLNSKKSMNKIY